MKEAILHLQNSLEFQGYSFGYEYPTEGEVVFNTAMVGYPESLTDPSYSGQILCITYPLIGNYGVPENIIENGISKNLESEKIHVKGVIISDYSKNYSHWAAVKSLDEWLKENKIPGIWGIDTREITKTLRTEGSMLGTIVPRGFNVNTNIKDPNLENQVDKVSCKKVLKYDIGGEKTIVMVDCGVKHNIIRCFQKRNVNIIRVPWDYDFNTLEYDGLFISNGPGDPKLLTTTINHLKKAMTVDKPILGICLGNQLLAHAAGATTYKMKYGNRSHNQPVRRVGTEKCYITSQNHGYAVNTDTLPNDWNPLYINMNDGTNEGIINKNKKFFSVQFHPEASSGPVDTEFIFDDFIKLL
ncbi:MAG: glutamine-hydrolyzing carbamoyl-phosphate synthase small subunit [Bacteroidales bacterium]